MKIMSDWLEMKDSVVERGGITAQYLVDETKNITFFPAYTKSRHVGSFGFRIASKGGGTTLIHLHIGLEDLEPLLRNILETTPRASSCLLDLMPRALELERAKFKNQK